MMKKIILGAAFLLALPAAAEAHTNFVVDVGPAYYPPVYPVYAPPPPPPPPRPVYVAEYPAYGYYYGRPHYWHRPYWERERWGYWR